MNYVASAQTETCGLWSKLSILALFLILFAAGCGDDDTTPTYPPEPPPLENDWLFDVFGTSATDVYACGAQGSIFRYQGTEWTRMDMGTNATITAIWGPGDGTLLACGHDGSLWRNTNGNWSSQNSGTNEDLYGLGNYDGDIYTCGANGALRKLDGSTWSGTALEIILRDPTNNAPQDTLSLNEDILSLVTVSYYGIGGAMDDPSIDEPIIGLMGTAGIVLGTDSEYDWRARRVKGSQDVEEGEWVWSSLSDPSVVELNYIGTSEGWLFRLTPTTGGDVVWSKVWPKVTTDNGKGILDMWLGPDDNLYLVTDEGQIIFQSSDFDGVAGLGVRTVLYDQFDALTGIWGADRDNIFVVGYSGEVIHCSHDLDTGTFDLVKTQLGFPNKTVHTEDSFYDVIGRPRH